MNNPRILLAAPTSKHKDYCFQKWAKKVKSICKISNNVDVLIVDNTRDGGKYCKQVIAKKLRCTHIEPKPKEDSYNIIARSQNLIRSFLINEKYDFLFMLESDQFPPDNIIEYLLTFNTPNRPVNGLPYFIGTSLGSKLLENEPESFGLDRIVKIRDLDDVFMRWNGTIKPKYNNGIGCMLVRTSVFKTIKFRIPENNNIKAHADVYFHIDLQSKGIPFMVSESFISHHENANWHNILK